MEKDLISIIMPCYMVENYIGEAIESVLNQTYKNIELIIVNDFTKDNSIEIAKSFQEKDNRIKIYNNAYVPNNISCVMNTGLDKATGKYVTRIDSDDHITEDKIEKQWMYLKRNESKKIIMCSTNISFIDKKGYPIKDRGPLKLRKGFDYKFLYLFENPLPAAPCMFIKKIIDENNLRFDEKYTTAEDYDFISRYLKYGNYGCIDEPLYNYRILSSGITGSSGKKTNINSLEISARNVKLFLDINPPICHQYLTRYYDRNVYGSKDNPKKPYLDIMELSLWAQKLAQNFVEKYNIPPNQKKKYYDYLNCVICEYAGIFNPQYIYVHTSLYEKVKYYYITYGLVATIKKIIKKCLFLDRGDKKC